MQGKLPDDYEKMTYREYWAASMQFAKALVNLNVPCFDIVNILGFNSVSILLSCCCTCRR